MSHHDPTLPRSDTATLPEADLISRVQGEQDSAALVALVNRHTGIYYQVVNRYVAAYPNAIKAKDMDDDKLFNLYTFVKAYDSTRDKTLCGYIHDRTDYLCKTMLKRDERNPLSPGTYAPSGAMPLDTDDDTYTTSNGAHITLQDQSPAASVTDAANLDIGIEAIQRAAGEVCRDPRFHEILQCRHFAPDHTVMSWREVGKRMHMSHENARKLYNNNLALVKARLST